MPQVNEAEPDQQTPQSKSVAPGNEAIRAPRTSAGTGSPLAPRPGLSIDTLVDDTSTRVQRNTLPGSAGMGTGSPSGLRVGAADDSYEREADAMADRVMSQIAPGSSHLSPPPMGRVARQATAEVGAEGGAISNDLASSIKASSGQVMPDQLRSTMESGFGTDFSEVRVHADSPAASKIQARAFTHGSDIHFAPGQFQPGSAGGQHLIAHELTHVVQQNGGVQRLMWQQTEFDEKTSESWTTKSTAQKEIRKLLAAYHTNFPFGDLDESKAKAAYDAVTAMKLIADAYLAKNVKEVDGETIERSKRSNRIGGMRAFSSSCAGELSWLKQRIDRGKDATALFDGDAATTRVSQSEAVKKVTDHYEGDATSCFRKLGSLIEMAVPASGDSASIALEVKIPVAPGATVNLGFGAEAERGDREDKYKMPTDPTRPGPAPKVSPVEVGLNVYVGAGGNVGPAAEVAGALGVYLKFACANRRRCGRTDELRPVPSRPLVQPDPTRGRQLHVGRGQLRRLRLAGRRAVVARRREAPARQRRRRRRGQGKEREHGRDRWFRQGQCRDRHQRCRQGRDRGRSVCRHAHRRPVARSAQGRGRQDEPEVRRARRCHDQTTSTRSGHPERRRTACAVFKLSGSVGNDISAGARFRDAVDQRRRSRKKTFKLNEATIGGSFGSRCRATSSSVVGSAT